MHPDSIHIQTYYSRVPLPWVHQCRGWHEEQCGRQKQWTTKVPHFNQNKSYLCNVMINISYGQGRELAKLTLSFSKSAFSAVLACSSTPTLGLTGVGSGCMLTWPPRRWWAWPSLQSTVLKNFCRPSWNQETMWSYQIVLIGPPWITKLISIWST